MSIKKCCVTGHRTLPDDRVNYIEQAINREIRKAVFDGFDTFISGFASGTDLLFAKIVLAVKKEFPYIKLEAAIPYRGRLKTKDLLFNQLICQCDAIIVISESYNKYVYSKRNIHMVENAHRVIAIYDGRGAGGTANTIRYALSKDKEIRVIGV